MSTVAQESAPMGRRSRNAQCIHAGRRWLAADRTEKLFGPVQPKAFDVDNAKLEAITAQEQGGIEKIIASARLDARRGAQKCVAVCKS